MKKIISLAMVMCLALPSIMSAQDEVSNKKFYIGGSLGISHTTDPTLDDDGDYGYDDAKLHLLFAPEFGVNINDRMSVGIYLGIHTDSYKYTDPDGDHKSINIRPMTIDFKPYFRYAFFRNERVKIFADAGFQYGITKTVRPAYNDDHQLYSEDSKVNSFEIGLYPGISYQISSKFSLVAHLGSLAYSSSKPDYTGAKSTNKFGLDLYNGTSFGLYFHF